MPLVSIIVPIYNVSDYLDKCLESISSQTLEDIEAICVNDGSTDSSLEIIQKYVNQDKRFKLIDKPNAGYGAAMNDGIAAASGQYIGIVEPDDYIDPDMYEILYEIATSPEKEFDLVKSAWREFSNDEDKGVIKDPYAKLEDNINIDLDKVADPLLPHPSIWSGIYRKGFLDEFDIRFKEIPGAGWADNPFFIETMYFAKKVAFTSRHFYNYRVSNEDSSSELKDATIPFRRLIEMLDFLDSHDERPLFRKTLYWRAFTYLRASMNSKAYPLQADEVIPLVQEFFTRMPKGLIEDSYFSKEDKENYLLFSNSINVTPKCENPAISYVIPCYNVAKYINKCVDSLKAQTLEDIEVIFVDDGSSDYTRAKLFTRTLDDDRMKVIVQDNKGAGAARNKGLEEATGKYVTFLDSDDLYEPTLAELSFEKAEETSADLLIYGADFYYEKSKKFEDVSWLDLGVFPDEDTFTAKEITHPNVFKSTNGWTWDKLFRTDFIRKNRIRFQEIRTHNDMLFTYTALLLAKRISVLHEKLIHQRKGHGTSLSQTGGRSWWCADEALGAVEDMLHTYDLYNFYERDFKNYVVHIFKYSTDNMHASDSLPKLYNAIKDEWIPKYDLPTNQEYYWVPWEYDWLESTLNNSVEEILMKELQGEIKKREQTEKIKLSTQKKLRTSKMESKKLRKKIARMTNELKRIKSSKSYKAAKKVSRVFHK